MEKAIWRKGLALGTMVLFVATGIVPVSGEILEVEKTTSTKINNRIVSSSGDLIKVDDEGDGSYTSFQDTIDNATSSYSGGIQESKIDYDFTESELDLLHGEALFYISAIDNVNYPFNVTLAVPPNYENQAPILIDISKDTTAQIISYCIVNDTNPPNKILNFTIAPMKKDENAFINFDYWVLVKNNEYTDLPNYVNIPKEYELPEGAKKWLVSTNAIQSNNTLIKLKARQLRGFSNNLIELGKKIVRFTYFHRYVGILWLITNLLTSFSPGWAKFSDAVSALFIGGACTGRANLGAALFRANGVPAKDLIVTLMVGKNIWYDAHYNIEYYCPDYGWVPAETTLGITPYEPKNNIILRVNYPEDENLAGSGLDYYGGCEPWFWINNKDVLVRWHLGNESGTRGWIEKEFMANQYIANLAFNLTQEVYELHTKYVGMDLSGENKQHFNNAILAQKNAIKYFNQSDVIGYFYSIRLAYDEYVHINVP